MSFLVPRRSRNRESYYLVESYCDSEGKTKRRTLCYLGREQDGTDSPYKDLSHWERVHERARGESSSARGRHLDVARRRLATSEARIALIKAHIERAASAEAARKAKERQAEEAFP